MPRVGFAELVQPRSHHIVVTPKLVAQAHTYKGRVVTEEVEQGEGFVAQEFVLLCRLCAYGAPERQFGVQVYPFLVGGGECGFGRGVGMEAEVVDTVVFGYDEDAPPLLHVGGAIGAQGEDAGIVGAAQEGFVAVDDELRAFGGELAHTEGLGYAVAAAPSFEPCFQAVEVGVELAPEFDFISHRKGEFQLVQTLLQPDSVPDSGRCHDFF